MKPGIRRRAFSLVDSLVAALILAVTIAAVVSMIYFCYRMSAEAGHRGKAYLIARDAVEMTKVTGFFNTAEGPGPVRYYDGDQRETNSKDAHRLYRLDTMVVSDDMDSGSPGDPGGLPSDRALRQVTVTVKLISTGTLLYRTDTYLARAGI